VDAWCAKPGIIGGDDNVTASQHLRQAEQHAGIVRHQRGGAGGNDAGGGVCPGDDVAAACRRRPGWKIDGARHGDRSAVDVGGAVEDAEGLGISRPAADQRPNADDGSGLSGKIAGSNLGDRLGIASAEHKSD
jgi:hypothetical protein